METLAVVIDVDHGKWLIPELALSLVNAVLEVWSKNNKGISSPLLNNDYNIIKPPSDPIFISILTDILTSLASSPTNEVYETVVKQSLPPLSVAINSATKEESWIASSAIDLVSSLVEGSPQTGLGEGFFALLAPNLFSCLAGAEDRDVLQVNLRTTIHLNSLNHIFRME